MSFKAKGTDISTIYFPANFGTYWHLLAFIGIYWYLMAFAFDLNKTLVGG